MFKNKKISNGRMSAVILFSIIIVLSSLLSGCSEIRDFFEGDQYTKDKNDDVSLNIDVDPPDTTEKPTEKLTEKPTEKSTEPPRTYSTSDWQTSMKNFLKGFPSIFDDKTIQKNEDIKWKADPNQNECPIDSIFFENVFGENRIALPYEINFCDLDNDDVPEIFIRYAIGNMRIQSKVYKLYGDNYEEISDGDNYWKFDYLFVNFQNKVVLLQYGDYEEDLYSINFWGIENKEVVLSVYIDSNGNTTSNGRSYSNMFMSSESEDYKSLFQNENLREIPQLYFPNIISETQSWFKSNYSDDNSYDDYDWDDYDIVEDTPQISSISHDGYTLFVGQRVIYAVTTPTYLGTVTQISPYYNNIIDVSWTHILAGNKWIELDEKGKGTNGITYAQSEKNLNSESSTADLDGFNSLHPNSRIPW